MTEDLDDTAEYPPPEPFGGSPRDDEWFRECAACAAKPGSPTLCPSCLANRATIDCLRVIVEELKRGGATRHDDFDGEARMPAALDYKREPVRELTELETAPRLSLEQELWVRGYVAAIPVGSDPLRRLDRLLADFRRQFPGVLEGE